MRKRDMVSINNAVYFFAVLISAIIFIFLIIVIIANLDRYEEDKFDAETICMKLGGQYFTFSDSNGYHTRNLDSLNIGKIIDKANILIISKECIAFKHKNRVYTEIPIYEENRKRATRAFVYYEDVEEMLNRKIDEVLKKSDNYFIEHGKFTNDLNLLHIDEKFLGKGVKINEFTKNTIEIEYEGEKEIRTKK